MQAQYRNDRTKLNEEMMKLYQEHKVNPLSSCLPLLAQMPVFIIMFRILYGLTYRPSGGSGALAQGIYCGGRPEFDEVGFLPRYISHDSELFQSLVGQTEMVSFGLDLAKSPFAALGDSFGMGLDLPRPRRRSRRALLRAAADGGRRAAVSPTMSPTQQKLMQYLPVAFAVFQVFFVLGLVIYYIAQAILRIACSTTSPGRSTVTTRRSAARRSGQRARPRARQAGAVAAAVGLFAQARELAAAKPTAHAEGRKRRPPRRDGGGDETPQRRRSGRPSRRTARHRRARRPSVGPTVERRRPGGPRSKSAGKRRAEEESGMEWVEVTAKTVERRRSWLSIASASASTTPSSTSSRSRAGLFGRSARRSSGARPGQAGDGAPEAGPRNRATRRPTATPTPTAGPADPAGAAAVMKRRRSTQVDDGSARRATPWPDRRGVAGTVEIHAAGGDAQQGGAMEERQDGTPSRWPSRTWGAAEEFARAGRCLRTAGDDVVAGRGQRDRGAHRRRR